MADSNGNGTPLLDELEKGPWPSFVTEIKSMAEDNKMCQDLLGQLEKSYRDKRGYWKHGGIVGVMGYGGGVIGRYSFLAEEFPNVAHFHTFRINQPAGLVLHVRRPADAVRHLGTARLRPDQHARVDRRHRVPGHGHRRARADLRGTHRRTISTWAGPARTCGRRVAAWGRPAANGPATTRCT